MPTSSDVTAGFSTLVDHHYWPVAMMTALVLLTTDAVVIAFGRVRWEVEEQWILTALALLFAVFWPVAFLLIAVVLVLGAGVAYAWACRRVVVWLRSLLGRRRRREQKA